MKLKETARKVITTRKDPNIFRGRLRTWADFYDFVNDAKMSLIDMGVHYSLLSRLIIGQTLADKYFTDNVGMAIAEARLIIRLRISNYLGNLKDPNCEHLSPGEQMIVQDALDAVDGMIEATTGAERAAIAVTSRAAMQSEFEFVKKGR